MTKKYEIDGEFIEDTEDNFYELKEGFFYFHGILYEKKYHLKDGVIYDAIHNGNSLIFLRDALYVNDYKYNDYKNKDYDTLMSYITQFGLSTGIMITIKSQKWEITDFEYSTCNIIIRRKLGLKEKKMPNLISKKPGWHGSPIEYLVNKINEENSRIFFEEDEFIEKTVSMIELLKKNTWLLKLKGIDPKFLFEEG